MSFYNGSDVAPRIALGASTPDVARLVLRHGMPLAGIGVVSGALLGLALGRFVRSMLWGIGATDPLTYLTVAGVLVLVALGANLVPALGVTRIDPLTAMRDGL